ncbi:MAG: SseB family protein [Treponema sp.]|nr:SseB family protein [Treponema sp.]
MEMFDEPDTSVTNLVLVDAMNEMLKTDHDGKVSRESYIAFAKELLAARLLLPVNTENSPGKSNDILILSKDIKISFRYISDDHGQRYIPAFTTRHELLLWNSVVDQKVLFLSFGDLEYLLNKDGGYVIVINPGTLNCVIDRYHLKQIRVITKKQEEIRR